MTSFDNELWQHNYPLEPGTHHTKAEGLPWDAMHEVLSGLFLTCEAQVENRQECIEKGIVLIINLCGAAYNSKYKLYKENAEKKKDVQIISGHDEFFSLLNDYCSGLVPSAPHRSLFVCTIAAEDIPSYDIGQHFMECGYLLELFLDRRMRQSSPNLPSAVIHCLVGVSRSASVVAAYLMKKWKMSPFDAISFLRKTRPVVSPNPGFCQSLDLWSRCHYHRSSDEISAVRTGVEIKKSGSAEEELFHYLYHLATAAKMFIDRRFVGLTVINASPDTEITKGIFVKMLDGFVREELYVDAPLLFRHVCEMVHSLYCYCLDHDRIDDFYRSFLCVFATNSKSVDVVSIESAMISLIISIYHFYREEATSEQCRIPSPLSRVPFTLFLAPFAVQSEILDQFITVKHENMEAIYNSAVIYFSTLPERNEGLSAIVSDPEFRLFLFLAEKIRNSADIVEPGIHEIVEEELAKIEDLTQKFSLKRKLYGAMIAFRVLLLLCEAQMHRLQLNASKVSPSFDWSNNLFSMDAMVSLSDRINCFLGLPQSSSTTSEHFLTSSVRDSLDAIQDGGLFGCEASLKELLTCAQSY